jgi:hypothetical protein
VWCCVNACVYCADVPSGSYCDGCGELVARRKRFFGVRLDDEHPWELDEAGKIWYYQQQRIPSVYKHPDDSNAHHWIELSEDSAAVIRAKRRCGVT